jgi:serine/threonine protein kinase
MIQKLDEKLTERPREVIETDMFKSTGKTVGYGCWGQVDLYEDEAGIPWAIKYFSPNETAKMQMQERDWTEDHVMLKESVPLQAAGDNVVPRIIARDKKGKMYVAMPYYKEGDLSSKLRYLDTEDALEIAKDIARALKYTHKNKLSDKKNCFGELIKGCEHGDVKPSNVLIENGHAYLSDFGSSTCISIGNAGKGNGARGDVNYRAPECDNGKGTDQSDVWSLGAILYEALTREGIRDGLNEINQKAINKKLRKVPRKIRKFLKKCLKYDPHKRFTNGEQALGGLEKTIENLKGWKSACNYMRKSLPWAATVALMSLLTYGVYTYEPKKLDMPTVHRFDGMLYPPERGESDSLEFIAENLVDLPDAAYISGFVWQGLDRHCKNSTKNRVVAYLVKTHMQAYTNYYEHIPATRNSTCSKAQWDAYFAHTISDERNFSHRCPREYSVVAKSLEVALNKAKIEGQKVDLEDVLAISRLGSEKVDQAKRLSGSLDWERYSVAKDSKGNLIISEQEREFVDQWLSYFHGNID